MIDQINQVFSNHREVDLVVLYGSRAKGVFLPGSDIDLSIKSDTLTTSHLMQIENQLDDLLLPHKIDLSLFNHIENAALLDHISRVGKVFYKRCSS